MLILAELDTAGRTGAKRRKYADMDISQEFEKRLSAKKQKNLKDYMENKNVDFTKMSLKELEEYRDKMKQKEMEEENDDTNNYLSIDSIT